MMALFFAEATSKATKEVTMKLPGRKPKGMELFMTKGYLSLLFF